MEIMFCNFSPKGRKCINYDKAFQHCYDTAEVKQNSTLNCLIQLSLLSSRTNTCKINDCISPLPPISTPGYIPLSPTRMFSVIHMLEAEVQSHL